MIYEELRGRVAIVTGAGSGLGRSIAEAFAVQGTHVVIGDLDEEAGWATAELVKRLGATSTVFKVDVAQASQVESLVKETMSAFGRLDVLINNAGISLKHKPRLTEISESEFHLIMNVNLTGAWLGMKYAIPEMLHGGGGSIVNLSSTMGLVAQFGASAYAAAKHGVIGLTKAAAIEFGQSGIRVNAICPGRHATPAVVGWQGTMPEQEWDAQVRQLHPATGRVGHPEEIAAAALFLCSNGASNIHGVALPVDGGWTAQ